MQVQISVRIRPDQAERLKKCDNQAEVVRKALDKYFDNPIALILIDTHENILGVELPDGEVIPYRGPKDERSANMDSAVQSGENYLDPETGVEFDWKFKKVGRDYVNTE